MGREQGLSVATVARRLGVAPATLRTWDRRYGLGPSDHVEGAHRRYSEADLARLLEMRRLLLDGYSPAQAVQALTGKVISATPCLQRRPADVAVHALTHAALALDYESVNALLDEELVDRGPQQLWNEVIVPVMVAVGERWQRTQAGIEIEHLLSESLMELFATSTRSLNQPMNSTPIILASADEELHSLPLYAVAASLAQHRVASRILGARTPGVAVAAAVRRTGPAAIFLWSQSPSTGSVEQLDHLPTLRPAPHVILGGPGWDQSTLPQHVRRVNSLDDAVTAVLDSLGLHSLA